MPLSGNPDPGPTGSGTLYLNELDTNLWMHFDDTYAPVGVVSATQGLLLYADGTLGLGGTISSSLEMFLDDQFYITDQRIVTNGLQYSGDYSSGFVTHSLVDKAYVDTASTNLIVTTITSSSSNLTTNFTYYGVNFAGNVDLTLPDPTGIDGFNFIIKDEGGNATLNRIRLIPSVGLIDGYNSVDMANDHQSHTLIARGGNWWII